MILTSLVVKLDEKIERLEEDAIAAPDDIEAQKNLADALLEEEYLWVMVWY
jgi:hypothetical protein